MRPAKRCHLRRCRSAALAMCTRVRKARLACGSGASSFESYTRESAPHAHRDRSPDRLCIPSRAASHRLNVKIGKNVNNHEGSRKKRTSRSRTARSRTSRGREAIGREAEEAPWGVGRGGRGSPDRTDEQARSTPGTTATGWGREKRARRPKGEMETPRSGHPLVRPLVRAAFGCLARDRAGPLRLRALL